MDCSEEEWNGIGWGEVRLSGKSSYVHGDDVAASRKVAPYPGKDDGRQI